MRLPLSWGFQTAMRGRSLLFLVLEIDIPILVRGFSSFDHPGHFVHNFIIDLQVSLITIRGGGED